MKDYEDEAFDDIEKAQQRKVAHGVTDGSKKDAALRLAREAFMQYTAYQLNEKERVALAAIDEALGDV